MITTPPPDLLDRDGSIYIAGHRGLAGSAIWRRFTKKGSRVVGATSAELDLRDRRATFEFIERVRPDVVVLAAARVGGILANATEPADFLSDNLQIQVNVMDAARTVEVPRLIFLGSSCIYPKHAPQPIREDSLLTGPLEPTNDAYAVAKIAGIQQVQAVRRQDGLPWISAMPTNLYGPGDTFDPIRSHVLPALILRFHEAAQSGQPEVLLWGTGTPRREFLHADDLASAVECLLQTYDDSRPINVGTGQDLTILELAKMVAGVVGYQGTIGLDSSKPDGTPQKLLDISRLSQLGWRQTVDLPTGIERTYSWFLDHAAPALIA